MTKEPDYSEGICMIVGGIVVGLSYLIIKGDLAGAGILLRLLLYTALFLGLSWLVGHAIFVSCVKLKALAQ